jgi:four helix bundle protein
MTQSFTELSVWQRSMQLAEAVYHLTQSFPREEIYGMTSQMRRAAVSIPSNIAEGQGRGTNREFQQFLSIARGSTCEIQTQLVLARRLRFGNPELIEKAEALSIEVRKMLFGLLDSLRDHDVSH